MLEKKQIWAIFVFEFKMGLQAVKTNCNINNSFGSGTASSSAEVVQEVCKGDKILEDEECSGWPLEVDCDQLRGSSKLILL